VKSETWRASCLVKVCVVQVYISMPGWCQTWLGEIMNKSLKDALKLLGIKIKQNHAFKGA